MLLMCLFSMVWCLRVCICAYACVFCKRCLWCLLAHTCSFYFVSFVYYHQTCACVCFKCARLCACECVHAHVHVRKWMCHQYEKLSQTCLRSLWAKRWRNLPWWRHWRRNFAPVSWNPLCCSAWSPHGSPPCSICPLTNHNLLLVRLARRVRSFQF